MTTQLELQKQVDKNLSKGYLNDTTAYQIIRVTKDSQVLLEKVVFPSQWIQLLIPEGAHAEIFYMDRNSSASILSFDID